MAVFSIIQVIWQHYIATTCLCWVTYGWLRV